MRVLVTGVTGFIGSYICQELDNYRDVELVGCVRGDKRLNSLYAKRIKVDFLTDGFENVIAQAKPDVIVHSAAISRVDYCEENRQEAWKVNVEATEKIAKTASKIGARMVFLSSDFVFSGQNQFETEESATNPVSFYGETKVAAEQKVVENCANHLIIRPVLVYGIPLQQGAYNIVTMIAKNSKEGKPLRIVSDQYRTPVFVLDLAKFIVKTVFSTETGVFHAGGVDFVSVYEFAVKIAETFGLDKGLIIPVSSAELSQVGTRPPITRFSSQKAREVFGYNPRSIDSALALLTTKYNL